MKIYSKKQVVKRILNIASVLVFLGLVLYYFFFAGKTMITAFAGAVCVLIAILFLYHEYLDHLFLKALYYLNQENDPDRALEAFEAVTKADIFKTYEKDRGLFDAMVAIEKGENERVIHIVEENDEKFRSSVEMLMIRAFFLMRAYQELGEKGKVLSVFEDIKDIEKMKKRPDPVPIEEYYGIVSLAKGDKKKAYQYFSSIDKNRLNPKERSYVLKKQLECAGNNAQKDRILHEIK